MPSATTSHNDAANESTIIIGAGIIGCATAYYLSHSGNTEAGSIHLIEASPELFASASGKSGGFLASDWFGPATASLGALSFQLHGDLADKHDGRTKWGYSPSSGTSLMEGQQKGAARGYDWLLQGGSRAMAAAKHEFAGEYAGPAWLTQRSGNQVEVIGEHKTVAQVDPLRLSRFLLDRSLKMGVHLHQPAKAVHLSRDVNGGVTSLLIRGDDGEEHTIPCTRLLITAGAWTSRVFDTLFPSSSIRVPVSQLAGHSIVVKSPRWTAEHEAKGCHAIFTTMRDGFSPEIFSRIGEEIYVAGLNDASIPLPEGPMDAKIDQESIGELKAIAQKLLGKDGIDVSDLEVLREGLCFRPVTNAGVPIVCRISDTELSAGTAADPLPSNGVFIAAGHGPWGISHSLGTGKVMSEMIEGRKLSADIGSLGMQL